MELTTPASSPDRDGVPILAMHGITKRFAGVVANDRVDFDVRIGEVHTLFGENGAGKSTLMRVLYGLYHPDAGEILINGVPVEISSPADAIRRGIGMIHQHFMLVQTLTVAENVALGLPSSRGPLTDRDRVAERIRGLSEAYHLKVDPQAIVWQLSVGERQRVEIVKALYRNVSLLILDEPTAVLTPQEVDDLFAVLRRMAADGKGLVFISHKVHEVLGLSDRITVLRAGRNVGTLTVADASRDRLVRMMVGRDLDPAEPVAGIVTPATSSPTPMNAPVERVPAHAAPEPVAARAPVEPAGAAAPSRAGLAVRDLRVKGDRGVDAVRGLTLEVHAGEIVGIAGVSGNGQRELAEAISGLRRPTSGSILLDGTELRGRESRPRPRGRVGVRAGGAHARRRRRGLQRRREPPPGRQPEPRVLPARVPACRGDPPALRGAGGRLRHPTPGLDTPVRNLSGGNIQKLIMARELSGEPRVLLVAQPTRGIDVAAALYIHGRLREQRGRGTAVLIISEDLDEVMSLADRVLVMYEGTIIGEADPRASTRAEIGFMHCGRAARRPGRAVRCRGRAARERRIDTALTVSEAMGV